MIRTVTFTDDARLIENAGSIFLAAMKEAWETGGRVYLVETTKNELVPAVQTYSSGHIRVYNAAEPIHHPNEYPAIWDYQRQDSYVRSKADALNLVHCAWS